MPTRSSHRPSDLRLAGSLPQVDPITFTIRPEPFDDPEWLFEPKYDGFRGMVYASSGSCEIRSRGEFQFDPYGDLRGRISSVLGARVVILDGEVVALNGEGKPVFRDLIRGQGYLAFAAFDVLWLDGSDLRRLPLSERKQILSDLLPKDTGSLYKILTLEEHGRALFSAIQKMDLEGIVAKRKSDQYGPATSWYKIPNPGYSRGEERIDQFRPRERRRVERAESKSR
jgi:bifunctional non-homologous end joining protein LigD